MVPCGTFFPPNPVPPGPLVCSLNTSPCFVADATGGDPSCHSFQFSPHLARALLEQVDPVCSIWPAFAELRAAAHSPKQSRLRVVISAAVCEARLIFAAAFFVAHGASRPTWSTATASGLTLFSWIRSLLAHGSALLQSCWRWSPEQLLERQNIILKFHYVNHSRIFCIQLKICEVHREP